MKLIILLLAIVAILCVSCKQNPINSPTEIKEIWPLKIGNKWITKTTQYDSLGKITSTTIDSMVVIKDTIINNERVFVLYQYFYSFSFRFYVVNKSDGFYRINIGWNDKLQKDTISYDLGYKYPGNDGETYIGFRHNMKILSTNSIIDDINNESFNCYKYFDENQSQQGYWSKSLYLSPGVGLIYSESYNRKTGGNLYLEIKTELQSYLVN